MGTNKNQHYVPQMYLRNFSADKKSINLVNIRSQKVVHGAAIKKQCSGDYFYGKESVTDEVVSLFEGAIKPVIDNIIFNRHVPIRGSDQHVELLLYLLALESRTLGSKIRQLAREEAVLVELQKRGLDRPVADHVPHDIQIFESLKAYPLCLDLDMLILVNNSPLEYFSSDNPVVTYNNWLGHGGQHSFKGVTHKGLTISLPLDPKHIIFLYDASVYRAVGVTNNVLPISDENIVMELNSMQVLSANHNLYFINAREDALSAVKKDLRYRGQTTSQDIRKVGNSSGEWIGKVFVKGFRRKVYFKFLQLSGKARSASYRRKLMDRDIPQEVSRNYELTKTQTHFSKQVRNGRLQLFDFVRRYGLPDLSA